MTQAAPQATFNDLTTAAVATYGGPSAPTMGPQWVAIPSDPTAIANNNAVGYSGQAWVNPATGELIIGDRGTVPTNGQNLLSDGELATGLVANAQAAADNFALYAVQQAGNYLDAGVSLSNIYTTGHSLGGYESQGQTEFLTTLNSSATVDLTGVQFTNFSIDAPGIGGIAQTGNSGQYTSYNVSAQGDLIHLSGGNELQGTTDVSLPIGPSMWATAGLVGLGTAMETVPVVGNTIGSLLITDGLYNALGAHSSDLVQSSIASTALGNTNVADANSAGLTSTQMQNLFDVSQATFSGMTPAQQQSLINSTPTGPGTSVYDSGGYDQNGYNSAGYNIYGIDKNGNIDPSIAANGGETNTDTLSDGSKEVVVIASDSSAVETLTDSSGTVYTYKRDSAGNPTSIVIADTDGTTLSQTVDPATGIVTDSETTQGGTVVENGTYQVSSNGTQNSTASIFGPNGEVSETDTVQKLTDGSSTETETSFSNGTVAGQAVISDTASGHITADLSGQVEGVQLSNATIDVAAGSQATLTGLANTFSVGNNGSLTIENLDGTVGAAVVSDSQGNTTIEFDGGSVFFGPLGQEISQASNGALNVAVGPSGNAQVVLSNGDTTGSPIAFSGVESMTMNLDGSYSVVDQSGNIFTLQSVTGSSNYVLGNSSGTLDVTLDTSSVASINLGQSISIETSAGGTLTVPVWGGSATLGSANLGDATVEQGSSVTIGSSTIDVSSPGSGTTQQYSFAPDGTVSSVATYDDSSAQTSPQTIVSYNDSGDQTKILTNNADGTSQIKVLNAEDPSAGFIIQTQNFTGVDGTGTLANQTTDFTDGLSEVDTFNPSAGALVTKTVYSDLDGTGDVLSQTTNYSDGTSTVVTYSVSDTSGDSQNSLGSFTSITTTYSGWDGTGDIQGTTYASADGTSQTGAQIGSVLGSSIGKFLGGNSIVESIGLSTVLGTLGKDIGKIIDLDNATGTAAGDISETVFQLADNALPDIATTGAGAIGAYLTGELVKDLGLTGLPAEIVDTGAGYAIATISSNLAAEATGANVAWDSGLDVADLETSFAGFAGTELASLVVTWSTPQQADAASIGAALGGIIGSYFGPIGSFIGSFVGDLLFGFGDTDKTTMDPQASGTLITNQSYSSPYSYQATFGAYSGLNSYVQTIGSAITAEMNAVTSAIGGTIANASDVSGALLLTVDANASTLTYSDHDEAAVDASGGLAAYIESHSGTYSTSNASDFVDAVVFEQLSELTFNGGDIYVERAVNATLAEREEAPNASVNLETLLGNIQIAKDYEKYLANEASINSLIAQAPTSNFSAGWILELQEAASLGLPTANGASVTPVANNTLNLYGVTLKDQSSTQLENLIDDTNSLYKQLGAALNGGVSSDAVILSGTGLAVALQRDSLTMTANGDSDRVGIEGSNNVLQSNGSYDVYAVSGSGNVVTENGDSDTLSIYGNSNSMTVNGRYSSIVISGTGNTLTNANGNITVANASSATINGVADAISLWSNSALLINGGQMEIGIGGDNNSVTANGNQEQWVVAGDGNTIVGNGQGDQVSVAGSNESLTLGSGSISLVDGVVATVNGEALGITVGNQDSLTVGGQSIGVSVSGDGDAVIVNGTSVGISGATSTSKLTMNGSGDSISVAGNNNTLTGNGSSDYLTISGNDNTLVANGQNFTATLSGANNTATIANGSVVVQNSAIATVNGSTDNISLYNTTQLVVNGGSMTASANGSQNTITLNGNDENVNVQGSTNAITDNGNSETVNVNGDSNNVSENGSGEWVSVNGSYDTVQGQLDSTTVTINGTGGAITATGNNNLLTENGTNDYLTVNGNNNSLNANGLQITASLSGAGNTVSIGNGVVSLSDNAGGTVNGVADQVNIRNTSQVTINGGSMSLAVNGDQNTITANGNANSFSEEGSNNLITGNGSNDSFSSNGDYNNVTLNGNSETSYVNGTDNVLAVNGQSNQITLAGTNNTLHAGGAVAFVLDNSTADFEGGGDNITVYNGDTVTVNGSGFSVTETATNSNVVANGDYNVVGIGGNHNAVTLNGNSDQVELSGSLNTVTISGQSATLEVSGVQQALAVNQGNITVDAGSQVGLAGNGNMLTLNAADTLTVNGSNNWVNVASNDSVTLAGSGNGVGGNATGVTAVLDGNGQYALLDDDAITLGAAIQASITGDGNTVGVATGGTLDLTGNANSVQMTGGTMVLADSESATASDPETGSSNSGFAVNGFDFTSYNAGEFSSAVGAQSLQSLADTGANSVSLVVTQYVQNVTDTDIEPTSATESDASLELAISEAQADGLSVTLKPHLDVSDGTWRAYLDPSNVAQFFSNYQAMIVHYAEIAQATGVGTLVIGTEMESLSGTAYEPYWDTLIAAVRQVYSGQLTYASGWNETANVSFWNKLDIIGADAYIPVTNITDPTVQQLETGWTTVSSNSYDASAMDNMSPLAFYQSLSTEYDKPVLFTEIGYQSVNDTNELEGAFGTSNWVDFQQQSKALQAFFSTFSQNGGNWFEGAYLWNWEANPAGVEAGDFSVQGKPGLNIVDYWYGLKSGTQSGNLTPNTLTGDSNTVTVGAGDALDLTGSNNQITLGTSAGIDVSGLGNQVQVTGGNNVIQTSGSTTINLSGSGTTAIIAGDSDAVSATGANDGLAITGDNTNVSLNGNGEALTISGNNSAVNVAGNDDTVSISGNQSTITVNGMAAVIQVTGPTNIILGGGADTVTLGSGVGQVTLGSGNDTVFLQDSDVLTDNALAGDSTNVSSTIITENDTSQPQANELAFSSASSDQLWFSRSGNDLLVSVIGTSSQIDVTGWYNGSSQAIQSFDAGDGKILTSDDVNALVSAMAAFSPPAAGSTTLPENYQSQLQPVIAANWH